MNREILYRGKRLDNGKWAYGYYVKWSTWQNDKHLIIGKGEYGCTYKFEVDPDTVGQYTGLKDKSGVKIFEGDILQEEACYDGNPPTLVEGSVSFAEGTFCAGREPLSVWLFDSENGNCSLNDITVIGNIHDNPELLKESEHEQNEN